MLNIVARNRDKETVLILAWHPGTCLTLHGDGRLVEYPTEALKGDLLESAARITLSQRGNAEMVEEAAEL
jgi:hypothetical protein